jgi:hypothetical protein
MDDSADFDAYVVDLQRDYFCLLEDCRSLIEALDAQDLPRFRARIEQLRQWVPTTKMQLQEIADGSNPG